MPLLSETSTEANPVSEGESVNPSDSMFAVKELKKITIKIKTEICKKNRATNFLLLMAFLNSHFAIVKNLMIKT
jgi:hypothetical protein